jgi:choline dehydrogenase
VGFGLHQVSHKDGARWSAARGYLHPMLGKENFTVIGPAYATRLSFSGRRCTGVVYRSEDGERSVAARREVIVSAGAICSPQLLLLSGIGGFTEIRDRDIPELQFHFGPLFFIHHGAGNPEGHGFVGFSIAVRPRSRGRVELRSANPADKPVIDPNMLDDEADTQVLVDGIRVIRDIVSCPALDEFRGEPYPAAAAAQSDDELRDYVRDYTQSLYHPVGTCRMGTDPAAVVDPQLRVRGVEGLRVADASIMPIIVNANTNFPSIMIGNKCAELILTGN